MRSLVIDAAEPGSQATRPATLQEVADAAAVHRSTASRALNSETAWRISPEVVARVQETAARLGYRRNIMAASMRNGRTRLVGVLVPDLGNPVFAPILGGLDSALGDEGYSMLVANASDTGAGGVHLLEGLLGRRAEGVILATTRDDDVLLAHCLDRSVPVVLVNRTDPAARAPSAAPDDEAGMALVVRHLIGEGHCRIAHLAGPPDISTGRLRAEGFRAEMRTAGLEDHRLVVAQAYSQEAGEAGAAKLLAAFPEVTAIVAANDLLALGAYRAIAAKGLTCPGDISVTGHNDMPLVDMTAPPLTTVRISHHQIGREAGRLLIRKINHPEAAVRHVRTAPSLILRASTQPPR